MTPVRLSAQDFLKKIKEAQEGQVYAEFEGSKSMVFRLLAVNAEKCAEYFIGPDVASFESNSAFSKFLDEIWELTNPPAEGAKNRTVKKKSSPPAQGSVPTMPEMNLDQIYKELSEKNAETGNSNAWLDPESNTLWMIGEENELFRFYGGDKTLKDMSVQEINDFVAVIMALESDENSVGVTCASSGMERECEVWAIGKKRSRRVFHWIRYGHAKHECHLTRYFARDHVSPKHQCRCGFSWFPQSTDND